MRNRLSRRTLLLVGSLVALLVPIPSTVVPEWRIRIIDQEGKPYPENFVRQSWKHYSLDLSSGTNLEDRWTDADGYVQFPERTIRACLLQRVSFPAWPHLMTLAHGSTGIRADVMVWGSDTYAIDADYVPGKPLPEAIILPR
jgi:hypothetical protein